MSCPASVELAPEEGKVLLVSLFATPATAAGPYKTTLRAESEADPTQFAEAQATVTILPKAAVKLGVPPVGQGLPGGEVVYNLAITNWGNTADSFRLELRSSWRAELSQKSLQLLPGERIEVTLTLHLPEDVRPGSKELCRILVRSQGDPTVSDEKTITTLVLPPPPERVTGSLFPTVPMTLRATSSWSGGSLSSNIKWYTGGTISQGRSLTLGGELNLALDQAPSLQDGWVKYQEQDWNVSIGDISTTAPVSTETVSIGYCYTPLGSPYSLKFHRDADGSSLDLSWNWNNISATLSLANGDFTLVSFINTPLVEMKLQIQESGFTVSLNSPSHDGFSLSGSIGVAEAGQTTVSLSSACGPVSGKLSFVCSESASQRTFSSHFASPLMGNWRLATSLKLSDAQGVDLHTVDSTVLFSLSLTGSPWTSSLTMTFDGSSDLVAQAEYNTISVKGESAVCFSNGWTLSLNTTLSQRLGELADPSNQFQVGVNIPFRGDSWHAALKATVSSSEQPTLSCTISSQEGSLDLNVSASAFSLSWETRFSTTLPFIATKGQLEGRVFIDANTNGQYDTGEKGISELLLALGDAQALSGGEGEFRFLPLPGGDYSLRILNLPLHYIPLTSMPIPVQLKAGVVEQAEVPLVEGAMITGRVAVFSEEQREGLSLEGSGREPSAYGEGLSNVSLRLTSDEETFLQVTDRDGHFQFERLRPGHWTLKVYDTKLPRFHYLEKNVFEFDLKPGDQGDLLVKVFVKRRPIQLLEEGTLQMEDKEEKP